jgi:hypothetical protein
MSHAFGRKGKLYFEGLDSSLLTRISGPEGKSNRRLEKLAN